MSNPLHHHHHNLHEISHHQANLNNLPKTNTHPRNLFMFFLKCIIMTCIISLFFLFLGFAALVLLHVFFLTTPFRRRTTTTSTTTTNIVNLPEVIYYDSIVLASQTEVVDDDCCTICLEEFNEGELCRSLPPCGHFFHVSCVDSWLMKVPSCPVCRTRVPLGNQETNLVMSSDDWKIWWAVST